MFASETDSGGARVDLFSSEAITRGVRVFVQAEYAPERSRPAQNEWFFLYTVKISNEGAEPVQLVTRHWVITDGTGHVEEVRGPGVVGQQPTLKPGESFEYTSGCPLSTRFGVMEGTYQMVSETGDLFDARIAPFALSEPYTVH
jgi:ApaG protein